MLGEITLGKKCSTSRLDLLVLQVLQHFEQTLASLINTFLDQVRSLFLYGRQVRPRFSTPTDELCHLPI
jgi:hypothetical protein